MCAIETQTNHVVTGACSLSSGPVLRHLTESPITTTKINLWYFITSPLQDYGMTPLCESGKGILISGAADFGAVMAFIPDQIYMGVSREGIGGQGVQTPLLGKAQVI